ncbi:hypothetical protein BN59_00900 [Legionella massiliensis]|uniref:Uncharacterized protein n=1 Tax=Legionella massiliensis TaxID=1034943 RepID=A0A078KUB1_9GAMM|nr:hypothetical protein [Legionella massiliensis]CDZ76626.1 hypothetical protein BN59_00900 [Legionella massiliensis]CEE12364.1 hypothetical protein BN1094_00900 [Legionella massiliensis]
MKLHATMVIAITIFIAKPVIARECHLPNEWQKLCPVLQSRVEQTSHKMKLQDSEAQALENYIQNTDFNFLYLSKLQDLMPKTTTELWMATYNRGLNKNETEKMAEYLITEVKFYKFKNLPAFDNNTSHIIGREWHEIDYSGENMTWEKQKEKYAPYGISNFKSLQCLQKFFPVESKLPYFNKIYQPTNMSGGS